MTLAGGFAGGCDAAGRLQPADEPARPAVVMDDGPGHVVVTAGRPGWLVVNYPPSGGALSDLPCDAPAVPRSQRFSLGASAL